MGNGSLHIEERTAEDYIRGIPGPELTDGAIANILFKRNVAPSDSIIELGKRTIELLEADTYIAFSLVPSVKTSVEDADGNWKHKEGGGQITNEDKRGWRQKADEIYLRYGETTYSKGPRVHARGMRIWRNGDEY